MVGVHCPSPSYGFGRDGRSQRGFMAKKKVKKANNKTKTCGKKSCSKKCNREKVVGDVQQVVGLGNNPAPEYPRLFRYQESLWTRLKRFLFCKL